MAFNKTDLNSNSENYFKWIFRRQDKLTSIVFIFISKINANNARYYPLFQNTKEIRFVYFPGLPIKYSDQIFLKIFTRLQTIFKFKIARYQTIHFFNANVSLNNQVQILHIDDPEYSNKYVKKIKIWEKNNLSKNRVSKIICTNAFTASWLKQNTKFSDIIIIEQGFDDISRLNQKTELTNFICAYSSPYIFYGRDKNSDHTTYGAKTLFDEIIPNLLGKDPHIAIYLIGKLGKHAKKASTKYPNVISYGRVNAKQNLDILSKCDIGMYPRKFDHKRSVLKIFTYIGAELPIVTFNLIDTEIVERKNLGFSVATSEQFVEKIIELKNNPELLNSFKTNIKMEKYAYSWENLAQKMEKSIKLDS
jgi:hypothetical protein